MTHHFKVHPVNPQKRLVAQAVGVLRDGGVIAYPTDSCYALGCQIGDKSALSRIRTIRALDHSHHLTLLCLDLSGIAKYAKVDNSVFRLLKSATPGPYTFLLEATRDVPDRLLHPKRKSIGVRVPDHSIARALLEALGEPLLSTSAIMPGERLPLSDPGEIAKRLGKRIDLVLDGGACGLDATTVVDVTDGNVVIMRRGLGDGAALGL